MQLGCSRDVLENVVPMMASVEVAFDTQRMCVLPTKDDQTGTESFVVSQRSCHLRPFLCCMGYNNLRARQLGE
jgi:hypothetical protein